MIPKKIGRYEVESELGRGGMAVVYLVTDPFVKRKVAVKLLPRQFTEDPQFRARFMREAQVIASLDHPAIVPIYDFGEDDGQPFIVMRYMTGGTLGQRLRAKGPMPPLEAARILTQIGSALDEAHSKGIVHRDMKPGNILFDHRGDAAIADFGIVKLTEGSNTLTGSNMIGTPGYMSPEQARGDVDIDRRSDLYALGAILFEMLTGQLPYQADTPMGVAIKHVIDEVPHILNINPNLPPAWDGVITRAMAKKPADRYGSATEMATSITSLATAETQHSAPPVDMTRIEIPPARPTPPPVRPSSPKPGATPAPPPSPPTKAVPLQAVPLHAVPPTTAAKTSVRPTPSPQTAVPLQPKPTVSGPIPAPAPARAIPQAQAQPAKRPVWILAAGGVILLLLCIGGAVGLSLATGLFEGSDTTPTPDNSIATGAATPDDGLTGAAGENISGAQAATILVTGRGAPLIENIIGSGSGFVYEESGLVLTNYHLVEGATTIEIIDKDGRMTSAEIVGSSPCDDVAVLQLAEANLAAVPSGTAVIGPGSLLLIVSYPDETTFQATTSAAFESSGQAAAGLWGDFQDTIVVNGAFSPGQSGAPLVADDGNVVGMMSLGLETEQVQGTAVSLASIRPILGQLEQQTNIHWLGLNVGPLPAGADLATQAGLFVFGVAADSPADMAGIRAGDFITEFGGTDLAGEDDLGSYCQILRNFQAGDLLEIAVLRGEEPLSGQINGRPLALPASPTPTASTTARASATLRPTNTTSATPGQQTNTPNAATNTPRPVTNTPAPPTAPPPTAPPPTSPPQPTSPPPPPTSPPQPTSPPPPPATNTPEPP